MPVSKQKLSAGLVVVVPFYCVFVLFCFVLFFFCFFLGGGGGGVARTLIGIQTHVRMVHAHTYKCKLSISFNSLKDNSHNNIILGKTQQLLIPNAFRRMAIKY